MKPPTVQLALQKGWPAASAGLPLEEIGAAGWNLLAGDLPLPCAALKESALAVNSSRMNKFLQLSGAKLCPHGKTTMSPELMHRQIRDGAWGIAAATSQQVQVMHRFGIRRVLLANQMVGRAAIEELGSILRQDPKFELFVLVDSVAGVEHIDQNLQLPSGRRLAVLLEIGQDGARTGVRSLREALAVAAAVQASRTQALRGIETYEGIVRGKTASETEEKIGLLYANACIAAESCEAQGYFSSGPVILSGGGSSYYDLAVSGLAQAVLADKALIIIRSGCYLTHDSGWLNAATERLCARSPGMAASLPAPCHALEVWAHIQSRPEPELAFATLGKRDVSHDLEPPRPIAWFRPGAHQRPNVLTGHRVLELNDQHAYLEVPSKSPLRIGDMVCFGVSHPCTTFDKWRLIPVVDDEYRVTGAVSTWF